MPDSAVIWTMTTSQELLDYVSSHCRTDRGLIHREHLRLLFTWAGERHEFLNECEWWACVPDVIDPLVARARKFLETRREDAEEAYRAAWARFRTSIAIERRRCEQEMDRLQPFIAESPSDPRWTAFIDALPGYRKWWAGGPRRLLKP